MDNLILFLIIFLIIAFFFAALNFILKRNNENYGVFCGRYNLHPPNAKKNCIKDSNCIWKKFNNTGSGKKVYWCTDNPSNAVISSKNVQSNSDLNLEEQLMPTWVYDLSSGKWITPIPDTIIGNWSTTNIKNSAIMTISFWLNITELNPLWRNIFNVNGSNGERTPGVWISPNLTKLHIRNDSTTTQNLGIDETIYTPTLNKPVFITIIFNITKLSIYINSNFSETYTYSPGIKQAASNSKFYMSEPSTISTGYQIKDFSIYNSALSENNVKMIYNAVKNNS